MNKEELYQKLGGIYGGQKELIDNVLNAFDNLEHLNKMLQWSKDRLNKSDYELQQENNQLKEQRQELRSWLEKQVFNRGGSSIDIAIEIHTFCKVLDKLNELEGGKNE